jgi:hypothetical protein
LHVHASLILLSTKNTLTWFLVFWPEHGGKVLARGGKYQIMEGPQDFHRFVVIEFPYTCPSCGVFRV